MDLFTLTTILTTNEKVKKHTHTQHQLNIKAHQNWLHTQTREQIIAHNSVGRNLVYFLANHCNNVKQKMQKTIQYK